MPDVYLTDPALAWHTWTLMQATGWTFLPYAGGLLDQPEALMDDIMTISLTSQIVKAKLDG